MPKKLKPAIADDVMFCEHTGKRVRVPNLDTDALLKGQQRIFSSVDVGQIHHRLETDRAVFLVHRNTIFANQNRNIRRFSTKASQFIDLMESMREEGIIQPLLVQRTLDHLPSLYALRAGFRRWEAAKQIGLDLLPITVVDDSVSPKIAGLLENIRQDMDPLETAAAIKQIMDEGYTHPRTGKHKRLSQRKVAKMIGISQSTACDLLVLAGGLHPKVSAAVADGTLPATKATILSQLPLSEQEKALEFVDRLDTAGVRRYAQEVREGLGVPSATSGSGKAKRVRTMGGIRYKVRPVTDLILLCVSAEMRYFKEGRTKRSDKVQLQILQYALGIIASPKDEPVQNTVADEKTEPTKSKKSIRLVVN